MPLRLERFTEESFLVGRKLRCKDLNKGYRRRDDQELIAPIVFNSLFYPFIYELPVIFPL